MIKTTELIPLKEFYYNNLIIKIVERYDLEEKEKNDPRHINPTKHNRRIILTNDKGETFETNYDTFTAIEVEYKLSGENDIMTLDEASRIQYECCKENLPSPFKEAKSSIFYNKVLRDLFQGTKDDNNEYYRMSIITRDDSIGEEILFQYEDKVDNDGKPYADIKIGRGTWGANYFQNALATLRMIIINKIKATNTSAHVKGGYYYALDSEECKKDMKFECGDFIVYGTVGKYSVYLLHLLSDILSEHNRIINFNFKDDFEDFISTYSDSDNRNRKLINAYRIKMERERMRRYYEQ